MIETKFKASKLAALLLMFSLFLSLILVPRSEAALPTANITLEGKPLPMLVPPVIVDPGYTLVSFRSVGEAVGGTVTWNRERQQATVKLGSDQVVLTLGSKTALVNGRPEEMGVPVQLINDRTMVPIRFIVEKLGGTIEWQQATRTVNILRRQSSITQMTYSRDQGTARVVLNLSEPLMDVHDTVQDTKLFLDLFPARVASVQAVQNLPDSLLKSLRLLENGRSTRLEAEFWHAPTYTYSLSPDGTQLTVELGFTITGVQFQQDGRIPKVNIASTGRLNYSSFTLADPARTVIDVKGGSLGVGVPSSQLTGNPILTQIRTSQWDANTARIVLDQSKNLPYDIIDTEQGMQVQFVPRIQSFKTANVYGKTRLTFAGNLPMDAKVTALPLQKQIRIEIPQGRSDLSWSSMPVADGTINTITVAPGATRNSTVITISLYAYVQFEQISKDGDTNIVLDLPSSPLIGKRIWIDAGHGGGDPGATGTTYGTKEMTANLAVSLALQSRLESAGAIVYMTRTTDAEGAYYKDRPAMVNAVDPPIDLFVSVHHNSAGVSSATGTETYYWTTNPASKALAEAMQPELVSGLGTVDRGVRTDNFYVITYTEAPSVLLELGFLSNPDEERSIMDAAYASRAANSIFNGIQAYFRQGN